MSNCVWASFAEELGKIAAANLALKGSGVLRTSRSAGLPARTSKPAASYSGVVNTGGGAADQTTRPLSIPVVST